MSYSYGQQPNCNSGFYGAQTGGSFGGQNAGYFGGQNAGYFGGQNAGYFGGQNTGYTGGVSAFVFSVPMPSQPTTFAAASYPAGNAVQGNQFLMQSGSSLGGSLAGGSFTGGQAPISPQQLGAVNAISDASTGSVSSSVNVARRKGRSRQEVIRLPDQPQGPPRQVRQRLPTPEPDVLERVYVQRKCPDVVEEITEVPMTPPPIIQERNVVEPSGPPQIIRKVVRVPPRSASAAPLQQQQTVGCIPPAPQYGATGGAPQYSFGASAAPAAPRIAQATCFYV